MMANFVVQCGIYYRFKFCMLIFQKGLRADRLRVAFSRYQLEDWDDAEAIGLSYPRELTAKLSPNSKALVEIRATQDIDILDRMYSRGVLLGERTELTWGLQFGTELHMTNDSKLFPPLPKWEEQHYFPDEYGTWLKGAWRSAADFSLQLAELPSHERADTITDRPGLIISRDGTQAIRIDEVEDVAVPLYEGRMIGQFDFSQKGWVSGKGRTAVWREVPWEDKQIEPQFLISASAMKEEGISLGHLKIGFMEIASSTNARTMVSTALLGYPCGHKVPTLTSSHSTPARTLALTAILNSLAFDSQMRFRLAGLSITWSLLEETSLLPPSSTLCPALAQLSARLNLDIRHHAPVWRQLDLKRSLPALTPHERMRIRCIIDVLAAHEFGLDLPNFGWLLSGCDLPVSEVGDDEGAVRLDPKGFWRVDKEKDPELRHTVLAQVAFADLMSQGLDAFLTGPEGDGWQLPETLRLADYGLGHDERAKHPQPVANRLGPRFLDWQLEKDPAQSWAECEAHAAQLDALWRHARQLAGVGDQATADDVTVVSDEITPRKAKPAKKENSGGEQLELF